MMVRNTRTGRVAEVLSQNDKLVRIRFQENGKEQSMTLSTYKRWWKKCDEVPETANEDVCGDGTPLAEVGKEIAEQAKQKAEKFTVERAAKKVFKNADPEKAHKIAEEKKAKEKKPREKFDVESKVKEIEELIKNTGFIIHGSDIRGKYISKKDIKGFTMSIRFGNRDIQLALTNKMELNVKPDKVRNTRFSKAYHISYSEQDKLVEYLNKVTYNRTTSKKEGK